MLTTFLTLFCFIADGFRNDKELTLKASFVEGGREVVSQSGLKGYVVFEGEEHLGGFVNCFKQHIFLVVMQDVII
jgi:hypothetical protein